MRVLVLSQRLPYAPNRGDRLRVFHMLKEIASRAEVDVASLVHDQEEESHAAELSEIAQTVVTARVSRLRNGVSAGLKLVTPTPLTHVLLDSARLRPALTEHVRRRKPDVVLAFCSSMAKFAVADPLSNIPRVIDMIDADSAKWDALADQSHAPLRWIYRREARLLERFEVLAMRTAFRTLVVNEKERAALRTLDPGARVDVLENGVDLAAFHPTDGPSPSQSVVFCGVMNYAPNVQAAVWLARDVWPVVRQRLAHAQLTLVGSSPSAEVSALHNPSAGVVVTGAVPDVRPYLRAAAVATAPLQVARGVQNKVLEAVAAGLPCVITPAVAGGLPTGVVPACHVADTVEQFASAIVSLLALTPEARREIATRADLRELSWAGRLRPLVPLLEAAASSRTALETDPRFSLNDINDLARPRTPPRSYKS